MSVPDRERGHRQRRLLAAIAFAFGVGLCGALLVALVLLAREIVDPAAREGAPRPVATSPATLAPLAEPGLTQLLPPGKRAIAAVFREIGSADAPLRPGDSGDVVAIFRGDAIELGPDGVAVAVVRGLTVLAVVDVDADAALPASEGTPVGGESAPNRLRRFTVAATPEEAQLISLAREIGELRIGRCRSTDCAGSELAAP